MTAKSYLSSGRAGLCAVKHPGVRDVPVASRDVNLTAYLNLSPLGKSQALGVPRSRLPNPRHLITLPQRTLRRAWSDADNYFRKSTETFFPLPLNSCFSYNSIFHVLRENDMFASEDMLGNAGRTC